MTNSSSTHLPRYNELASTFSANSVDSIICMSVNHAFVMNALKQDQEAQNITLTPDDNGEFTDGMRMLVGKEDLGLGKRSWRYSMLLKNSVVEKMFVEPGVAGDPFGVSDADTMLEFINPDAAKPSSVAMITKPGYPFCVKALSGNATVPKIFFDGKNIGGFDDLKVFLQ